jgi:hypothetical protein
MPFILVDLLLIFKAWVPTIVVCVEVDDTITFADQRPDVGVALGHVQARVFGPRRSGVA